VTNTMASATATARHLKLSNWTSAPGGRVVRGDRRRRRDTHDSTTMSVKVQEPTDLEAIHCGISAPGSRRNPPQKLTGRVFGESVRVCGALVASGMLR